MAKRSLRAETFDIDLLEARYPDCIKTVKQVDYSKLYAKAKAHQVTGEPIPGVVIMNPDGTTIPAITQQVAEQNIMASEHGLMPKGEGKVTISGVDNSNGLEITSKPAPSDYLAA